MRIRYYTRLHAEILRQGWSFAALSRATGIHAQTIADYCHDRPTKDSICAHRIVPRHHVDKLARVLEVDGTVVRDRGCYILEAVAKDAAVTA